MFDPNNSRHSTTWEDLGVDGSIILKRALYKQDMKVWTGFSWHRLDLLVAFYEALIFLNEYILLTK